MAALPHPTRGVVSAFGSGTYPLAADRRRTVIVLDHDAPTRGVVAATLDGFRVHEADCLATAEAMLSEVRPGAIVCSMDFQPLALACFVRELHQMFGRSVALVMLTSRGNTTQAIRALQLGARATVDVPIDPVRLRTLVAKHAASTASAGERSGAA